MPWKEGLEASYERKKAKYADLVTECKESGWSVRLYPVEVGARGFVGRSTSCLLKDLGLRGATLSRSTKELSEEAEKVSHWLKRRDKIWGVTSNWVLLQRVSGRRPCSLPCHQEMFWVKGRNVNEWWSPAEDSAAKPRGMRSGLVLPQGRGCPCHAQSTTGNMGGATGLRSSRKTTSL